jgi:hypothetical protein
MYMREATSMIWERTLVVALLFFFFFYSSFTKKPPGGFPQILTSADKQRHLLSSNSGIWDAWKCIHVQYLMYDPKFHAQ